MLIFYLLIDLFIPFSLQRESLAKLYKRKIYYILGKKNYCSGEGLEGNIRTIRASPPKGNACIFSLFIILFNLLLSD